MRNVMCFHIEFDQNKKVMGEYMVVGNTRKTIVIFRLGIKIVLVVKIFHEMRK
ncbi:hypothetical protein HanPI659440_Chr01g0030821 [Helianthus annuus]|nr:hypothetical protein HanPI659440_Chr01g0030821 [Helianthus annuus]